MSIRGEKLPVQRYTCVWVPACVNCDRAALCMYIFYMPAYKSLYVCRCLYLVTYMSVAICNYVADNVFYYPIEVGFCSLLFQTTDISCDGRGTSDLVSVPHFQL